jgi:hypothetical protein
MPDTGTGNALLEAARAFRPRILAERDQIEASRRLPEDLTRDLARAGFFRIFLPEAYGGLDLTPMAAMEVLEELARADASVAWCVWNGNTHWTTAQLAPEVARTIHAHPDVVTANSTRASGQAQTVAGGYRVSGRWSLVSGCELGTWMVLLCVVHEDGKPRLTPAGAPKTRFMLLPSAECTITHGRSAGCAARAVTMWWCAIGSCPSAMVVVHGPARPARGAISHSAPFPRHSRARRHGARDRPNGNRDPHRNRGRENPSAHDPNAAGKPWCPSSGVPGRVARALGAAVSA